MEFWLDKDDLKVILYEVSLLLVMVGFSLVVPLFVAKYYMEDAMADIFLVMLVLFSGIGFGMKGMFKTERPLVLKHAAIVATLAWLIIPLISVIPFLYNKISFIDAFFETMSGWTATGLSLIPHTEAFPKSVIFWRSYMQWVGGMGIVVLALSILRNPGAMKLYMAEGRTENLKTSIKETVRSMWTIYLFYTLGGILLVYYLGMPLFESINHVMTALATGGFSVTYDSIAGYGNGVKLGISLIMILGGMSFVLHYALLKGRVRQAFRSTEFRLYLALIAIASILIGSKLLVGGDLNFSNGVDVFFQASSAITGTGFTTVDLAKWSEFALFILVILMVFGPCAGSTGGALKTWRVLLVLKSVHRELMRHLMHSNAVMPIKMDQNIIDEKDVVKILSFVLLYIGLVMVGGLFLMWFGYSALESIFLAASAQGNVGITFVPVDRWFAMADGPKLVLMTLMWAGRIELFPVLTLLKAFMPRKD